VCGCSACETSSLVVTCTGVDSSCKRCNVDGDMYPGNERFRFTKYGLQMECACSCDSTYTCRGYQIISSGENPEPVGCKSCIVNGQRFNGNTRFQTNIDGQRKVCSCNCNGEHSCSTFTSECRDCSIGGETYRTNHDFTLTRNGNSIRCRCNCNADFQCEGKRVVEPSIHDGCRDCLIVGVKYKSDTSFKTDVGGIRMLCECGCSGNYVCRGYRSITNVLLPGTKEEVTKCQSCYVANQERPGNSKFRIQRECYSIECVCSCTGTWDCPQQVPTYTCSGREPDAVSVARQLSRYSIAGSHVFTTG